MSEFDLGNVKANIRRLLNGEGVKPFAKRVGAGETGLRDFLVEGADTSLTRLSMFAKGLGLPVYALLMDKPESAVAFDDPAVLADFIATAMLVEDDDLAKRAELLNVANAVHTGLRWLAEEPASARDPGFLTAVRKRIREVAAPSQRSPSQAA